MPARLPARLPSGTVTFLFSDIEGSTRLLQRLGAGYVNALATHQALLRGAFAVHGGQEVDTQGDSFFIAFPTAGEALAAAADGQRALAHHTWPADAAVHVRMGLHTGAPVQASHRYVGLDVHRAARIATAGHGGQVLLSQATRDLAEADLPAGAHLQDLGEHRLKDLQRPEHLYQLVLPGLPSNFPPLKSLDRAHHNLPVQLTPLVGREEAVQQVVELVQRQGRLVTLTGPGGIGKTRLALQVAAELVGAFDDGVYLVPLGSIADAELVIAAIARTVGVREAGSATLRENLTSYLAEKRVLLVLDNFEHVLAAGPHIVELLVSCPRLAVLTTSRIALHLRGEHEVAIPPLALPTARSSARPTAGAGRLPARPGTELDLDALSQYAAVALFIERAQAVNADFAVTNANAPAIAEICARLDGLPLAIELAAARTRLLSPQALLPRLSSRLTLLIGGARDLPERQQTLRNAIAWSHDLLTPAEQTLFRRLAVFAGGCTLEAAEEVCAAPAGATSLALDVLDGVDSLAAQSLLRQQEASGADEDGEPRFQVLETIREYGLERLRESGEAEALHRAHLASFLALAERAQQAFHRPGEGRWFDKLEREHDNFRAALGWCRERADAAAGLRLAGQLEYFWFSRGYLSEGRDWLEGLLALHANSVATVDRVDEVQPAWLPEPVLSRALYAAGDLALWQGDFDHAVARLGQSLELARAGGDLGLAADALNRLGIVAANQDAFDVAEVRWKECLEFARQVDDPARLEGPLNNLGEVAYIQGDLERAAAYYEEALACTRQVGDAAGLHVMLGNLGNVARLQGDLARARRLYREALQSSLELGDPRSLAECLEFSGILVAAAGHEQLGVRLLGASEAARDAIGAPALAHERMELDASLRDARAVLGEAAYAAALEAGRALSLDDAVVEALQAIG